MNNQILLSLTQGGPRQLLKQGNDDAAENLASTSESTQQDELSMAKHRERILAESYELIREDVEAKQAEIEAENKQEFVGRLQIFAAKLAEQGLVEEEIKEYIRKLEDLYDQGKVRLG